MKNVIYKVAIIIIILTPFNAFASKFDGNYNFNIKTTRGNCIASAGKIDISDGLISGALISNSEKFKIKGKVKDDGTFKGRISGGIATFKGSFNNNKPTATWRNRFGCAGDILIR